MELDTIWSKNLNSDIAKWKKYESYSKGMLTASSSTESEFIAAVTAAKLARYLHTVLKQLGFPQTKPTVIFIDNLSALKIINDNTSPTDRTRHMDLSFFAIQDWREAGDIVMSHIAGILNPSDDLTRPLGWVHHFRHCR
jgi:hypothetical protein